MILLIVLEIGLCGGFYLDASAQQSRQMLLFEIDTNQYKKCTLNIDKGLAGFLGGKSKITIYDRRIVSNDTLQTEQYQINSEVDLGVYVLGIRMKEFGYRVIEIIDKNQGIIWQKFTSVDGGSYFVIRILYPNLEKN